VATPTLSLAAGTYVGNQTVTISDTTAGASVYYTTDGSTPTTSSTPYTGPIAITQSTTLRAIGAKTGLVSSDVAAATYVIIVKVATPVLSLASGTYGTPQTLTISVATSGATIYYTTNGSVPTTSSASYGGPISIASSMTVRAMAAKSGMDNSDVAAATYVIKVATPSLGLAGGTFNTPQTLTITDATAGAAIYYTTNGSVPTTASTLYTGPIAIAQTMTVRVMAAKSGMADSDVASATYTMQVATPTFNPPGGNILVATFVSISDATPGVTIYYTTDGSTPTTASSQYSGPILVLVSGTLKAIAVRPGWSQSAVATATYHLGL
jgi:hypothetical protein